MDFEKKEAELIKKLRKQRDLATKKPSRGE
jgi:hypothetical protein